MQQSVDVEMFDDYGAGGSDEDLGAVGVLPDLPDTTQQDIDASQDNEEAENAEVLARLKDLSKGAAKKVIRRPQPKLDPERLTGDRGIPILPKLFEKMKFKGKGHEASDLASIMRQMEHWGHRLFPKMPFDEVIERVEKLGSKKPVQTCVKKIRLDMPVLDDDFVGSDRDGDDNDDDNDDVVRNGEQQTHKQNTSANGGEDMWDSMIADEVDVRASQLAGAGPSAADCWDEPPQYTATRISTPSTSTSTPQQKPGENVGITPEQQAKMERNRQLALERRMKKTGRPFPSPLASQTSSSTPSTGSTTGHAGFTKIKTSTSANQADTSVSQATTALGQSDNQNKINKSEPSNKDSKGEGTSMNNTETVAVKEKDVDSKLTTSDTFGDSSDLNQRSDLTKGKAVGDNSGKTESRRERMMVDDIDENSNDSHDQLFIDEDTASRDEEMSEVIERGSSENIRIPDRNEQFAQNWNTVPNTGLSESNESRPPDNTEPSESSAQASVETEHTETAKQSSESSAQGNVETKDTESPTQSSESRGLADSENASVSNPAEAQDNVASLGQIAADSVKLAGKSEDVVNVVKNADDNDNKANMDEEIPDEFFDSDDDMNDFGLDSHDKTCENSTASKIKNSNVDKTHENSGQPDGIDKKADTEYPSKGKSDNDDKTIENNSSAKVNCAKISEELEAGFEKDNGTIAKTPKRKDFAGAMTTKKSGSSLHDATHTLRTDDNINNTEQASAEMSEIIADQHMKQVNKMKNVLGQSHNKENKVDNKNEESVSVTNKLTNGVNADGKVINEVIEGDTNSNSGKGGDDVLNKVEQNVNVENDQLNEEELMDTLEN